MRDFAEETPAKNGADAISMEPEIICELRDFAEDTLSKNGTESNYATDTLSAPNLNNICFPENMAVFEPDARETFLYITNRNNCPIFFSKFFTNKNFNFLIFSQEFFTNFKNKIMNVRCYQFWFSNFNSHIQNLGGTS